MSDTIQHDTLDQTIANALDRCEVQHPQDVAEVVRDALIAAGHFAKYDGHNYWPDWWPDFPDTRYKYRRVLVLDFGDGRDPLVGVGCGNAKKDTP